MSVASADQPTRPPCPSSAVLAYAALSVFFFFPSLLSFDNMFLNLLPLLTSLAYAALGFSAMLFQCRCLGRCLLVLPVALE